MARTCKNSDCEYDQTHVHGPMCTSTCGNCHPDDVVDAEINISDPADELGKVVYTRTGTGDPHRVGHVVAYSARPTFILEDSHGEQFSWIADLCRTATTAETIAYWKARALSAEARIPQ